MLVIEFLLDFSAFDGFYGEDRLLEQTISSSWENLYQRVLTGFCYYNMPHMVPCSLLCLKRHSSLPVHLRMRLLIQ